MEIVVLDGYALNPGDMSWKALEALGNCVIYDRTAPSELYERIKNAEVLITNKAVIDAPMMERLPKLRYIGVTATGYNVVDVKAADSQGIVVTNIPAYSTDSVAQFVFAHLLNIVNRVELHTSSVRQGEWANSVDFAYWKSPQTELAGKILGIVGYGRIGRRVAKIGEAFGMKVLFNNRSQVKDAPSGMLQTNLEDLFAQSDMISINCPLTPENSEFVNSKLLHRMKPSAILINTGRGGLIHEADLAHALNEGTIAAAGIDVLSSEPPRHDNPLLSARNCYITPHIAWATTEARQRLMDITVENLKCFQEGKPQNVVR